MSALKGRAVNWSTTYAETDLEEVATRILAMPNLKKTILFYGEPGAGKTTLIKALVKRLGYFGVTNSPTYGLVNVYSLNAASEVYHIDAYRLTSEVEAFEAGLSEYLNSANFCFVEWPECLANLLSGEESCIIITVLKNNFRKIELIC